MQAWPFYLNMLLIVFQGPYDVVLLPGGMPGAQNLAEVNIYDHFWHGILIMHVLMVLLIFSKFALEYKIINLV